MTTYDDRDEVIRLAELLLLSALPRTIDSDKVDELLTGLESERKRLGKRKFLVFLTQTKYDYDGPVDWVFPLESFDTKRKALSYTHSVENSLFERQTAGPDEDGKVWHLESKDQPHPILNTPVSSYATHPVRALYDQTYNLQASLYDRLCNRFRVIGPFRDHVVSNKLFTFINGRWELSYYFTGVGEATKNGVAPPQPQ